MNTFFFDLDGTLLPMDQDLFVKTYFKELANKFVPKGFEADQLIKAVWAGTKAMVANDGTMTNEQCFWDTFSNIFSEEVRLLEPEFEKFYLTEFNKVKEITSPTPLANICVQMLKEKGYTLILATNPIFPRVAILARIKWAGLNPDDFELITTYENSCYSKPNLEYYRAILKKIGKGPEKCVMVGNDVKEDMCALQLGMNAFLLNDYVINEDGVDNSQYKQYSFQDLTEFIKSLPTV